MREMTASLDAILGDFKTLESHDRSGRTGPKDRRCVTIWMTPEDKARYDRLQELSKGTGRKFSNVAREAILALIDLAEDRAS